MAQKVNVDAAGFPDIILPVQHGARTRQLTAERRLMVAVLDDAINCVAKYRSATDGLGQRLLAEEIEWLLSEDTHWPYSFECICDVLDFDAAAVRAGLHLTSKSTVRSRVVRDRPHRATAAIASRTNGREGTKCLSTSIR